MVSSRKVAVFNQAMLYSIRKPVTVLKDEQMMTVWQVHVSLLQGLTVCIWTQTRGKWRLVCEQCWHYDLSFGVPDVSRLNEQGVTAAIVSFVTLAWTLNLGMNSVQLWNNFVEGSLCTLHAYNMSVIYSKSTQGVVNGLLWVTPVKCCNEKQLC